MTAFAIKVIAAFCMLIDHIGAVFPEYTPAFFRWIGRIAFPIYAYMIAQGCRRTKNINKYLLRLGVFALVSEIPFDMAFMHYTDVERGFTWNINFLRNTNVFYTLFLGAACIAIYEKMKTKKHQWPALLPIPIIPAILLVNFIPAISNYGLTIATIVMGMYTAGALCFANFLHDVETFEEIPFKRKIIPYLVALPLLITAGAFHSDYGMFGVGLIFILYAKPENKIVRTIVLTAGIIYHYGHYIFSGQAALIDGIFVNTGYILNMDGLYSFLFALISVILVFIYNGKQGPKVKWSFYGFYPVHIAILAVIWFISVRV